VIKYQTHYTTLASLCQAIEILGEHYMGSTLISTVKELTLKPAIYHMPINL
jgi:hypothetical protein